VLLNYHMLGFIGKIPRLECISFYAILASPGLDSKMNSDYTYDFRFTA